MNNHKVSVVITNYNGVQMLRENLPSVSAAVQNISNNIREVIIVDDASNDDSVNYIKENYSNFKLIVHAKNKRFAEAVNSGFRAAKGELVCLLNNDVKPSKNFLSKSYQLFEDEKLFGVSLAEEGYSWAKGYFDKGYIGHRPGRKVNPIHSTFWISGGSGVFRKSMWNSLKGLDSKLYKPFYWEDLDISYRAMKRGWKLLWDPNSKVEHIHESTNKLFSTKYRTRIQERNQLLFIWKNIASSRLIKQHFKGLLRRIIRHPGYIRIVLMALWKLRIVISKRRIEKKESKISDESIFEMH